MREDEIEKYKTGTGYLLLGLSIFGLSGIHRFYLGKYGTGILWLLTWGFFGLGTFVDLIRMPRMVRDANLRDMYSRALNAGAPPRPQIASRRESVEHAILRVARRNKGPVSASEVALETGESIDEAKKQLDMLVDKGFAELRVRANGQIVYVIPDFLDPALSADLEGA
jgi:hypothetical protein